MEMRSAEVEHLAERGGNAHHRRIVQMSERAFDEAAVVDRAQLIDEQIGTMPQRRLRGHADTQRLGVIDEINS